MHINCGGSAERISELDSIWCQVWCEFYGNYMMVMPEYMADDRYKLLQIKMIYYTKISAYIVGEGEQGG